MGSTEAAASSSTAPTAASSARPRTRWGRRIGIGCGGLVALLIVAAVAVWFWKPWAPPIQIADPGPGGVRVETEGVFGTYYAADGSAPGIVVWGGSEGGLHTWVDLTGRALQAEGYHVLVISYFGGPGQPGHIEEVPLETFDRAIGWLQQQPDVAPGGVGIVGASKGGEAAMLTASRNAEVAATVSYVPSSVVWQGFNLAEFWTIADTGSSWSVGGEPVPYLPYGETQGYDAYDWYVNALERVDEHPEAVIPVDEATGPILLICGGADTSWPSCPMSHDIVALAESSGGPDVTLLEYPDAGHLITGPPVSIEEAEGFGIDRFGGTPETNVASTEDSWPQVLAHLDAALRGVPTV